MLPLPEKLLLVEDNPIIAMNTESLLGDLGVREVVVVSNVREALASLEGGGFDFAILDFHLGDNEVSLPVAARLVVLGVRFVFATGFGEALDVSADHGAIALLNKPYRFADLERAMKGHG